MDRKKTGSLKVLADNSLSEGEVVINPNDGFDLGLMMTETSVEMILNINSNQKQIPVTKEGVLIQKNDCTLGTVCVPPKLIEKIKTGSTIYLHLEEQDMIPRLLFSKG